MTGHDDCQIEKRSAGDEADATDERIGLLGHLPQQTGKVQAETNATDASRTCYHSEDQANAATQHTSKTRCLH